MADEAVRRPMKFPYTFSAKLAQFPVGFYFQNSWLWKFLPAGLLLTLPLIVKIHNMSNSPGNVAQWDEIRRKEREGHH